jgi:hypothetical protein
MIFLWLALYWFTVALCKPPIRHKWYLGIMDAIVLYVFWPFTLGKYLRSKLEKEE